MNKRHAKPTGKSIAVVRNIPATEKLSDAEREELEQQMEATIRDILTLTRRYIRMDKRLRTAAGKYISPTLAQTDVIWIVNRATWSDNPDDLYEMAAKIAGETPL